jgi:hypothetical protein
MPGIQILCPASCAGVTEWAVANSWAGPVRMLVGFVEDPGGFDAVGELPRGQGDGAEGGVDRSCADRGDGGAGIEQGHDIEFGLGVCAVEVAQQGRWRDPPVDHVDAQRATAGLYGSRGAFFGLEELAGVGQERLPVDGGLSSARSAGEQPHTEVLLQRDDALGDGLLGDRQVGGGFGELARVRDGDEGSHGIEIHADQP